MELVLTSKLGVFVFDKNTILSKAKLIRDSITAQFFMPKQDGPKIKDEASARMYAHQLGRDIEDIPFDLTITAEPRHKTWNPETEYKEY